VDYAAPAKPGGGLKTRPMSTAHRPGAGDLDATFVALSDATRREIIRNLLQKPRRAGELADMVSMSPQALSRHLRLMRRAGLVVEEGIDSDARVRVYSVHPDAFAPVQSWLAEVEDAWRRQLQAFKAYAEQTQRARKQRS
jgi:DNA-binding transcriptional ArsR family regulator